jgi:retron-type reverse transcriptase
MMGMEMILAAEEQVSLEILAIAAVLAIAIVIVAYALLKRTKSKPQPPVLPPPRVAPPPPVGLASASGTQGGVDDPRNRQRAVDVAEGSQSRGANVPLAKASPTKPPAPQGALQLDLGTFAPMSDEQIRQAASGINLWANIMFGRRDLIPPVTDPRTLLIDKAMVAHGFATPEELAEIHRVGAAMDEIRPDISTTVHQADLEVQRLKEEHAALKARKKAEAAERKRLHAQAVAQRRATDIIFLGRGVSKGLADRSSDVGKLQAAGLPLLATPADVSAALDLPIPRLRWLAFHSDAAARTHYIHFTVPKRSGGTRRLSAPHKDLATAQEWILRNVLDKVALHTAAHGFVKGHSTVTNAAPHVGAAVIVNADLEQFFPTITFPRVLGIFKQLGYSPAVSTIFALLCTEAPRRTVTYAGKPFHVATGPRSLPQGACTSPALSNLAARRLDSRLNGIATKLGWTYTRYADDMTFSLKEGDRSMVGYLLARLRHIAQDEGFAVNENKTRILKQTTRQTVTGVVVNARPGVPRKLYKRLRAILHRAKHEGLAKQNREKRPNFEAWLAGMIAYIKMVNAKQGTELAAAFESL